jgi:neutral ceramidase
VTGVLRAGVLRAGIARRDITPALGTPAGLGIRTLTDEVWDPLSATVLVIESADTRMAIAGLDVMGLLAATHEAMQARIARAIGVDSDLVVLNASHTHSGPYLSDELQEVLRPYGLRVMDDDYARAVGEAVEAAAVEAAGRLTPIAIEVGRGRVERVAANRRPRLPDGRVVHRYGRPPTELRDLAEGVIDPDVAVIRFVDVETACPIGAAAVYACHPTAAGGDIHGHVSADFVGLGRALVEAELGAPMLFLQGCGGDVGTGKWVTGTAREDSVAMGERFAGGVIAALQGLRRTRESTLMIGTEAVPLDLEDLARALGEAARGTDLARVVAIGDRLVVAQRVDDLRVARVTAAVLGDVAIVFLPGEVFVEHGLAIRGGSPFEATIVVAYNDNTLQYIPTSAAFPDGEYEVDGGWRYIKRGQGERLVRSAIGLLRRLAAGGQSDGSVVESSGAIHRGAGAIT